MALEASLAHLRRPSDEQKFVGLLLVSKHLTEKARKNELDTQNCLEAIFDAVGFKFLLRLVKTGNNAPSVAEKAKETKENKAMSPYAVLAVNIISTLCMESKLRPRLIPVLPHVLSSLRQWNHEKNPRDALEDCLSIVSILTPAQKPVASSTLRSLAFISEKIYDLLETPQLKRERSLCTDAVRNVATSLHSSQRIDSEVNKEDKEAALRIIRALSKVVAKDQDVIKFEIVEILGQLFGLSQKFSVLSNALNNKSASNYKIPKWSYDLRTGIREILTSRTKSTIRIAALQLCSLLLSQFGPLWSVGNAKDAKEKDKRGEFPALLVSITAVELQVLLLTDIPQLYLPEEANALKEEVKKELEEKKRRMTEEQKKKEKEQGGTGDVDPTAFDEKIPMKETTASCSEIKVEVDNERKKTKSHTIKTKKYRCQDLFLGAVVCFDLLESYLKYLCGENEAPYDEVVEDIKGNGDVAEAIWETLEFRHLMSIRKALSDAFFSILQFFQDCIPLGISLGECPKTISNHAELSVLMDNLLTRGVRCLGTWMRLETTEHRDKLLETIPFLLSLSKPPQYLGIYLIPGLLEMAEDAKMNRKLIESGLVPSILDLFKKRLNCLMKKQDDVNPTELILTCELLTSFLDKKHIIFLEYLPVFSNAIQFLSKSDKNARINDSDWQRASLFLCMLYQSITSLIKNPKDFSHEFQEHKGKTKVEAISQIKATWKTILGITIPTRNKIGMPVNASVLSETLSCMKPNILKYPVLSSLLGSIETRINDQRRMWAVVADTLAAQQRKELRSDVLRVIKELDDIISYVRRKC